MVKCRYIKEYLGRNYSSYNYGCTGRQAKRNRRLGNHIIKSRQKRELMKTIKEMV